MPTETPDTSDAPARSVPALLRPVDLRERLGVVSDIPDVDAVEVDIRPAYAAKVRHLDKMLNDLWLVVNAPVDEDEGCVPPTSWAIDSTNRILYGACMVYLFSCNPPAGVEFPQGYVSQDDRGGVRIEWGKPGEKSVRLSVAPSGNKRSYLYFEQHDEQGIRPATPIALAETLRDVLG